MNDRSRRDKGDGAIGYNAERGRWEGRFHAGLGPDGRRVRKKVIGKTRTEVANKLKELRRKEQEGIDLASKVTVEQLLERYLESRADDLQASTMTKYQKFAERHLIPAVGKKRAADLRPQHVEAVLAHLARRGYSRATITEVRNLLASALAWAVARRVVSWNAAEVAEIPRGTPTKGAKQGRRSLTRDETVAFLAVARGERLGALLGVMATLGLRPGEATALRWTDIDLDRGILTVSQAWKGGSHPSRHLGDPKTSAGRRTLVMPEPLTGWLKEHRRAQAAERLELGIEWPRKWWEFVFVTESGTPIDPGNLRRLTKRIAKEAGIPVTLRPYELRHTVTSLLADDGATNEQLADFLGHASTRTLESTYRHRLSASKLAAGQLDAVFQPLAAGLSENGPSRR